jgi:hypothetical protein
MLSKPFLALCSNRNSLPKSHPGSGSPDDWLNNNFLKKNGLFGISFDFFVNWSANPASLTPLIWIKRILSPDKTYPEFTEDLKKNLEDEFGEVYLSRLVDFGARYNLQVQFIIFRDDYLWADDKSSLLVITASKNLNKGLKYLFTEISITQFKQMIQDNSGGEFHIGKKGLIYGSSMLECYLSRTDSLYPGDLDLLLLNEKNQPVAILEYKKHTQTSSIDSQGLSRYYPAPDGKKYNRIAIFRDYLNTTGLHLPILIIYFPTQQMITHGKMEIVSGNTGSLKTISASNFNLPSNRTEEQALPIIQKVKNAINYYLKNPG